MRLRRGGVSRHPVLACIGDSHTYNASYLSGVEAYYPAIVAGRMGYTPLNLGVSGNSTAQVMNRRRQLVRYGLPDKAIIYAGTNDLNAAPVVAASPAPTSTVFSIDTGESYYVADGWIKVAGESAQIASVSAKQITLTAALAGGAPAAGAAVTIDTQKNLESVIAYLLAAGMAASKIWVVGQHYLNFASSGDTTSAQQSLASQTRTAQAAAAAAKGVTYINTYAYMRALILAGAYVQGSNSWHVAASDSHLNAIGQRLALAEAVYAAVA